MSEPWEQQQTNISQPALLSIQFTKLFSKSPAETAEDDEAGLDGAHGELHAVESVQADGDGRSGVLQHRQDGLQRR